MALVLVMFPGLQQPGNHESSRVNITICKGIQTYNTPHCGWAGLLLICYNIKDILSFCGQYNYHLILL